MATELRSGTCEICGAETHDEEHRMTLEELREFAVKTNSSLPENAVVFSTADLDARDAGTVVNGGCRVYWGSHGCKLKRDHDGPHLCDCAEEPGIDPATREYVDDPGCFNVGGPPYYGPETRFYGEDATLQERGEA